MFDGIPVALTEDSMQRADGGSVSLTRGQQETVEAFSPLAGNVLGRMRAQPDSGRLTAIEDFKRNDEVCTAIATIYPDDRPDRYRLFVSFTNKKGQRVGLETGEIDVLALELERAVVESGWEVVPGYCMRETGGFGRLVTLPKQ